MNRLRKRLLTTALFVLVAFLAVPSSWAHARPKVMVPAADSVGPSPATISVTFSESIEPRFSSLNVTDEHGKKWNTTSSMPAPNDPKTLTLALPALAPGNYLVQWISVAADGHRMNGEYQFTVK